MNGALTMGEARVTVIVPEGDPPKCPKCGHPMGQALKGWWKGYCGKCKFPFEVTTE